MQSEMAGKMRKRPEKFRTVPARLQNKTVRDKSAPHVFNVAGFSKEARKRGIFPSYQQKPAKPHICLRVRVMGFFLSYTILIYSINVLTSGIYFALQAQREHTAWVVHAAPHCIIVRREQHVLNVCMR
jgi:hypothetical protein